MPISFALAALLAGSSPDSLAQPLITAERGFAADAQRMGVRLAFLSHFDAESWLFRPHPTAALPALARDPDDGTPLEWGPDLAGTAASGDMGFTSGPWSAHAPGVERMAHGHFLTIWKRAPDGVWRVQVDGGIGHPALERPADDVKVLAVAADNASLNPKALDERRSVLERNDDELRRALDAGGDVAAMWHKIADPEFRALRSGHAPATGDEAFALISKDAAKVGSGPRRAFDVASSGDLAYTIGGSAECKACGSYFRVWHWSGERWRVLVDLGKP